MNLKIKILIVIVLLVKIKVFGIEIFVSPKGSDRNSGTFLQPFKTLERAQEEARKYAKKEKVIVYLRGGTYNIEKTIVFDAKDSGKKGRPIIYAAYKGEIPVISGGKKITNWKKDGNYIYKAPSNGQVFRQLYVNNTKALRSRYPNGNEYLKLINWNGGNKTIRLEKGTLKDWKNFNEIEIFVQMSWSISIMRLEEFTPNLNFDALTVTNPEKNIVFKRKFPPRRPNQAFHLENSREFIDVPGEWSLDKKNEFVYYYPRHDEDMSKVEVIVPGVTTLFHIKGSLNKPVKYLQFKGIKFMHSNWTRPSEKGYLNIQAGQYNVEPTYQNIQYVERPPAAVLVEAAHNVVFERNIFNQIGAVALDLHYGTKDCEVVGNVFYDISGTAISHAKLSDPGVEIHLPYNPKDKRELCVNDRIHNNYITKTGFDYGGAIGILSGWPVGVEIDHNEIKDLAYTGISVGWGWTHESSAMKNVKIRWNKIDNPCSFFGDGGGIYTLSEMPGSLVFRNHVFNVNRSEWATGASTKCFYFDEGSGGITIQENLAQAGEGIERYRFHDAGEIISKPKKRSMYDGIKKEAGLLEEYQDIKNKVKLTEKQTQKNE
ncbi:MAG: hypothetical protein ABF311_07360 [Polaribacter sp.]